MLNTMNGTDEQEIRPAPALGAITLAVPRAIRLAVPATRPAISLAVPIGIS
jgi:hypothetical protein